MKLGKIYCGKTVALPTAYSRSKVYTLSVILPEFILHNTQPPITMALLFKISEQRRN